MSRLTASRSSARPAGRPSTIVVRPGPWLSPAVMTRSDTPGSLRGLRARIAQPVRVTWSSTPARFAPARPPPRTPETTREPATAPLRAAPARRLGLVDLQQVELEAVAGRVALLVGQIEELRLADGAARSSRSSPASDCTRRRPAPRPSGRGGRPRFLPSLVRPDVDDQRLVGRRQRAELAAGSPSRSRRRRRSAPSSEYSGIRRRLRPASSSSSPASGSSECSGWSARSASRSRRRRSPGVSAAGALVEPEVSPAVASALAALGAFLVGLKMSWRLPSTLRPALAAVGDGERDDRVAVERGGLGAARRWRARSPAGPRPAPWPARTGPPRGRRRAAGPPARAGAARAAARCR